MSITPIWINNFNKKLFTKEELRQWLVMHEIEYNRYLDKTYSYHEGGYFNQWMQALKDPEIAYAVLQDRLTPNQSKIDAVLKLLANQSIVLLIVGIRGSGKTAFVLWLAEELHKLGKIIAIVQTTIPNLPDYFVEVMTPQQAPPGSFVIYDEAGISIPARRAMAKDNVNTSSFLMISRHQDKTIAFISQHSKFTDVNILRLADVFFFKIPSIFEIYEESGVGRRMKKYINKMTPTHSKQTLFTDFSQWLRMETPLPTFWTEMISKTYSKLTEVEAVDFIQKLHKRGSNPKQIAKQLIPRGIEWDTLEIKNAITSPVKMKENIKGGKK